VGHSASDGIGKSWFESLGHLGLDWRVCSRGEVSFAHGPELLCNLLSLVDTALGITESNIAALLTQSCPLYDAVILFSQSSICQAKVCKTIESVQHVVLRT